MIAWSSRRGLAVALVLIGAVLLVARAFWPDPPTEPSEGVSAGLPEERAAVASEAGEPIPAPGTEGLPSEGGAVAVEDSEDSMAGDPLLGSDNGWAAVDLGAVRAAMPENLYWRMGVPTSDPEILRWREEERARWNVEYGKVLSNTATEEEVVAYFEHRDRLASDYVEFITHILENYGESLTLRDVGLLKVAAELNLARLEEIPRQMADALERRKAHAEAREAWRREQALFASPPGATR